MWLFYAQISLQKNLLQVHCWLSYLRIRSTMVSRPKPHSPVCSQQMPEQGGVLDAGFFLLTWGPLTSIPCPSAYAETVSGEHSVWSISNPRHFLLSHLLWVPAAHDSLHLLFYWLSFTGIPPIKVMLLSSALASVFQKSWVDPSHLVFTHKNTFKTYFSTARNKRLISSFHDLLGIPSI